jgi:murein DD-endopeptidase MepM/ murein hydrolase activator NlpD
LNKNAQKSDKREYTLKIIPHQGGDVRSLRLPMKTIKYSVATICTSAILFVGAFCYSTYNASLLQKDQVELDELRQVNTIQQTQILQLAKKAANLQEDMNKLDELEGELRQLTTGSAGTDKPVHDGQGGPGIKPNIENLNETLNSLEQNIKIRRANLENLKANIVNQQAKLAVTPSIWPANGEVSSRYGLRWGGSDFHPGIDIAADIGTPIVATADGVVIESGWNSGGYGYMVDVDHGNGIVTRYGHNSQLAVSVGTTVKKGQVIAYMGSTGFSTGPHLHYEVRVNGKAVNPDRYL